jgi:acyl carrier protein phosphodiesterase
LNFLAHLVLSGDDEGLRLGAMLGDFVRGRRALKKYPEGIRRGIELHRFIDGFTDDHPAVTSLREQFDKPFRRYSGIIIDMALDHELAMRWSDYRSESLEEFDDGVRRMLERNRQWVPGRLDGFMQYADRRGLFAAYREVPEIIHTLQGIGRRFLRSNPLHQVDEIWADFEPRFSTCFTELFPDAQANVEAWLASRQSTEKSTINGS